MMMTRPNTDALWPSDVATRSARNDSSWIVTSETNEVMVFEGDDIRAVEDNRVAESHLCAARLGDRERSRHKIPTIRQHPRYAFAIRREEAFDLRNTETVHDRLGDRWRRPGHGPVWVKRTEGRLVD